VSLVEAKNQDELAKYVSKALSLLDLKLDKSIKKVVIKPNLCYYWSAATGYTTDPRLVEAIIDVIRENYGQHLDIKIAEADASAMRTKHAFQMLGYTKLAERKEVELVNLSKDVIEERKVTVNGVKLSYQIPKLLLEADLFVNVPKLKVMREVAITCALKNLFGAIAYPRKVEYHPNLNEAIIGVCTILKPDLTIVDGLIALGRVPFRLNLIMASADPFSIDWIAAQIMGYNPSKIKFLRIAVKEELVDPKNIAAVGENISKFARAFPRNNYFTSKLLYNTQLGLLKIYNKVIADSVSRSMEEQ